MEIKQYGLGFLVGRFQTIHIGHEQMIRTAAALCERVGIFVGSSQESGTQKNPFSYELRQELLYKIFGDRIAVYPLPDIHVGNNSRWGEFVLGSVKERFGTLPDLFVSGKEARRSGWFDNADDIYAAESYPAGRGLAELYIPKAIDVSASQLRELCLSDDRDEWQRYTPEALWDDYDRLRRIVAASQENARTESI